MENTVLAGRGITEKVLNAYSNIENSRLKFIVSDLIKHLHAYIEETKVTDEEARFFGNEFRKSPSPKRRERLAGKPHKRGKIVLVVNA
jgi:hypothetical protein